MTDPAIMNAVTEEILDEAAAALEGDEGGAGVPLIPDEIEPPPPEYSMPDVPTDPPDPAEAKMRAAKSNRTIKYVCTSCGRDVGRGNLKVKRAQFREMGVSGRIDKSRVTGWLCMIPNGKKPSCLDQDPDWQAAKLAASPGMADTSMAAKS